MSRDRFRGKREANSIKISGFAKPPVTVYKIREQLVYIHSIKGKGEGDHVYYDMGDGQGSSAGHVTGRDYRVHYVTQSLHL